MSLNSFPSKNLTKDLCITIEIFLSALKEADLASPVHSKPVCTVTWSKYHCGNVAPVYLTYQMTHLHLTKENCWLSGTCRRHVYGAFSFSPEEAIWRLLWSFCLFDWLILSDLVGKLFSLQDALWLIFRARTHPRGCTADRSQIRLRARQALIYYGLCTAKESFGLADFISYRKSALESV